MPMTEPTAKLLNSFENLAIPMKRAKDTIISAAKSISTVVVEKAKPIKLVGINHYWQQETRQDNDETDDQADYGFFVVEFFVGKVPD